MSKKKFVINETNTGLRRKKRGVGKSVTQKLHEKMEMPPVTFDSSLYKTHALLCSKIAVVHAIEVHEVRTWMCVYFRHIFRFL